MMIRGRRICVVLNDKTPTTDFILFFLSNANRYFFVIYVHVTYFYIITMIIYDFVFLNIIISFLCRAPNYLLIF